MQQPKVFVIQRPKPNTKGWTPNLTPAAQYGSIRYIFEPEDQVTAKTTWAMNRAESVLEDFCCERDFILWPYTGDPAAFMATMLVLGQMSDDVPFVNALVWERNLVNGQRSKDNGFYSPVRFDLQ